MHYIVAYSTNQEGFLISMDHPDSNTAELAFQYVSTSKKTWVRCTPISPSETANQGLQDYNKPQGTLRDGALQEYWKPLSYIQEEIGRKLPRIVNDIFI